MADAAAGSTIVDRYLELGLRLGRHVDGFVDAYYGPAGPGRPSSTPSRCVAPAQLVGRRRRPDRRPRRRGRRRHARRLAPAVAAGPGRRPPHQRPEVGRRSRSATPTRSSGATACAPPSATRRPSPPPTVASTRPCPAAAPSASGSSPGARPRPSRSRSSSRCCARSPTTSASAPSACSACPRASTSHWELAHDQPWSGFNYYEGDLRSRVAINTDLPVLVHEHRPPRRPRGLPRPPHRALPQGGRAGAPPRPAGGDDLPRRHPAVPARRGPGRPRPRGHRWGAPRAGGGRAPAAPRHRLRPRGRGRGAHRRRVARRGAGQRRLAAARRRRAASTTSSPTSSGGGSSPTPGPPSRSSSSRRTTWRAYISCYVEGLPLCRAYVAGDPTRFATPAHRAAGARRPGGRRRMTYRSTLRGERFTLRRPARAAGPGQRAEVGRRARRRRRPVGARARRRQDGPSPTCTVAEIVDTPLVDDDVTALRARRPRPRRAFAPSPGSPSASCASSCSRPGFAAEWSARPPPGDHPRDRGGGREADGQQGPHPAAATLRGGHALPQHDGRARRVRRARPAEPPGRRPRPASCSSAVDGLLFGCGDAVIGVNPATDSVDDVAAILRRPRPPDRRAPAPRRSTAASPTSRRSSRRSTAGAPVDLLFQSIAGTRRRTRASASRWRILREGRERCWQPPPRARVACVGDQVMYFETGQGSALSAEAHHGVDQLTLEARAYGVARAFDPFLVNTVVGFIGPEYLYDERQIIRAGLEDHFMGKLLGLPMGVRRLLHQPRRRRPELDRQPARCCSPPRAATTSWACRAPTT